MDSSWGWIEPRSDELWARQFGGVGGNDNDNDDGNNNNNNNRNGTFRGGGRNSTNNLISQFRFQAAKSIRTSTIILSVFNVVAAFATALGILWDGYATAKRNNPKYKFRYSTPDPALHYSPGGKGPRAAETPANGPRSGAGC